MTLVHITAGGQAQHLRLLQMAILVMLPTPPLFSTHCPRATKPAIHTLSAPTLDSQRRLYYVR